MRLMKVELSRFVIQITQIKFYTFEVLRFPKSIRFHHVQCLQWYYYAPLRQHIESNWLRAPAGQTSCMGILILAFGVFRTGAVEGFNFLACSAIRTPYTALPDGTSCKRLGKVSSRRLIYRRYISGSSLDNTIGGYSVYVCKKGLPQLSPFLDSLRLEH